MIGSLYRKLQDASRIFAIAVVSLQLARIENHSIGPSVARDANRRRRQQGGIRSILMSFDPKVQVYLR
jgi:hypothetical protein